MTSFKPFVASSLFICLASPLASQNIEGSNLILSGFISQNGTGSNFFNGNFNTFNGRACIGPNCDGTEPFIEAALRLKSVEPYLRFEDSSETPGISTNDWQITVNDENVTKFSIEDIDGGTIPFTIDEGVPDNTLYLAGQGRVGVNTSLPDSDLHVVGTGSLTTLILDETSGTAQRWGMSLNEDAFFFHDQTFGTVPFTIETNAPNSALFVDAGGNIGLGTNSPGAPLEVRSSGSFNFFRISASGAAVNDSVDITFTGGPLGTGQLRYNIVDGDNQEMSLDADGNMVLDGTLTTAGPTCAGGCDRVFDADYPLPSIEEHAAQMFAAGYLPSVGATLPNQPVNMTEQMAKMLNALEHAHIYIDQLHTQLSVQEMRLQQVEALLARQPQHP